MTFFCVVNRTLDSLANPSELKTLKKSQLEKGSQDDSTQIEPSFSLENFEKTHFEIGSDKWVEASKSIMRSFSAVNQEVRSAVTALMQSKNLYHLEVAGEKAARSGLSPNVRKGMVFSILEKAQGYKLDPKEQEHLLLKAKNLLLATDEKSYTDWIEATNRIRNERLIGGDFASSSSSTLTGATPNLDVRSSPAGEIEVSDKP